MALTTCRECSGKVSSEALACPHCGAPDPAQEATAILTCRECGEVVSESCATCPNCGAPDPVDTVDSLGTPQTGSVGPAIGAGFLFSDGTRREEEPPEEAFRNTSGEGREAVVPHEVRRRWNWGAFLLGWLWGLANHTYIALLTLIPLVNIPMAFVLGARGNEWAWQNRQWESVEHFKKIQGEWAVFSVAVWIILFFVYLALSVE